ncbi:MAG: ACT domain-containing protein [Thermodesulfobacteriota bacterium]
MKVEQLSIFLENKSGRLAEVTRLLGASGINTRALTLADTTDFGILRLIVNDNAEALRVLKKAGFTVGKTEVVAIEVPDRPGGLAEILDRLGSAGINVEYMYAFVEKSGDDAVVIFRFDDIDQAIELLRKSGVEIMDEKKVYLL